MPERAIGPLLGGILGCTGGTAALYSSHVSLGKKGLAEASPYSQGCPPKGPPTWAGPGIRPTSLRKHTVASWPLAMTLP